MAIHEEIIISIIANRQAMAGFRTQFTALQKQLTSLSKSVNESMQNWVRPSLSANQAVQGIINKQKDLVMMSKNMKKSLEQTGLERMTKQADSFGGVLGLNLENWRKINKAGLTFTSMGGKLANKLRLATHGMRGFRMEMLGVMFFGMMMQKTMFGMLRPAGEAFGLFDLWQQTLLVVFLPLMQVLFPVLLSFMQWLMDLPDPIKKVLGGFVLFMGALGAFLMVLGQVALGLGSIAQIKALGIVISSFSGMLTILKAWTASEGFIAVFGAEGLFARGEFIKGIKAGTTEIGKLFKSFETNVAARTLSIAIGLVATYFWAKTIEDMMTDVNTSLITRLKSVFEGAIAGALLGFGVGGVAGGAIGLAIGIGLSITFNLLDIAWETEVDEKAIGFFANLWDTIKANAPSWLNLPLPSVEYYAKAAGKYGDFIWRPGSAPIEVDPNDTIVGAKGGVMGGINITQYNTISGSNISEIDRAIRENNSKLADEIKRLVAIGG